MKSNVIFFLILLLFGVTVNAQVMLKKNEMSLKEALIAIAKDEQLKLVDSLDEKTSRQPLTQVLSGEGQVLLAKLSDVLWILTGIF
ncbi:hypothetical protein B4907_22790, partial [Yersinia kristensenii]